jgi:hypothetical protein
MGFVMRGNSRLVEVMFALLLSGLSLSAQQTSSPQTNRFEDASSRPASTNSQSSGDSETNLVLKEIKPGIYELGDVRIDKTNRTVSFPARLNLIQGPMEYFLVTTWGKTHESILKTGTEPYRIHVAMLLLDARGGGTNAPADFTEPAFVSHPANIRLPGDDISVEIGWSMDGKKIQRRAEELIYNRDGKAVMTKGEWVYNGSVMYQDIFIAQEDGSIVSLVTDRCAMINNMGPGHDNDGIWAANTNNLPPADAPLEVTLRLNKTTK